MSVFSDINLAPFTGFGDEPSSSIKFRIMRLGAGEAPNWTGGDANLSTFRVLHSNDTVTQYGGREPREITFRLWFAALDDLEALDSVVGRTSTLRYLWGITNKAGGTKETRAGRDYLTLPDTLLVQLGDQQTYINGTAEAVATFRRSVGIGTMYDYAYYAEEAE